MWADGGNDASVGNFAVRGDLVFADSPDGFGARGHASTYSLG
jgi:hypothetical protein